MISKATANLVILKALSTGADFAEIFFEDRNQLNIKMREKSICGAADMHLYGVGIYVLSGCNAAYGYSNDTSIEALLRIAEKLAKSVAYSKKTNQSEISFINREFKTPNPVILYPSTISHSEKINVLKEFDASTRSYSNEIKYVEAEYMDTDQRVLIANSEGLWVEDRRVCSRVRLSVIASDGVKSQLNREDYSNPVGFECFKEKLDIVKFAGEAVNVAVTMLHAADAPSVYVPVVVEAGKGGTLFHEACGHSLEATAVADGNSEFSGKLGQVVASEKVTLIDDGTLGGLYGSAAIDDEGMKTQRNVLIEKGILKGYLIDRLGARKMNMAPTGSGRRQNYTFAPTSRMSNTYLATGMDDEDEMIHSINDGLYAKSIGGGTVNPITGEFNFEITEGYWIKNGGIANPVRGMSLIGRGSDVLNRIDRVGKKLQTEYGSFCGSSSGLVCVTAFQPRVRISGMLVGGKGSR